jgi:FG-GAP-like repeat
MFTSRRGAGLLAMLITAATVTATSAATAADPSAFVAVGKADRAGLSAVNKSWSASTVDFNRDGRQDVWIGFHGRSGRLWKNRSGGVYRRVARRAWPRYNRKGRTIDRHDCAWADVNRDRRPDAYCSTGRFMHNVVKYRRDNELWLQRRRGGFHEVGTAWHVGDPCGRGRHVTFINANGDRWPDLFLGNHKPRRVKDPCNRPRNGLPNEKSKLFINVRGQRFRYAPGMWSYGAGPGTRCAETLDFDGDGWQDLVTCREPDQTSRLYRNRRGRGFVNITWRHKLRGRVNDVVVADLDQDGDPDLVTAGVKGFGYHPNEGGRFEPRVWIGRISSGHGRSVAVGDADGDGDRDVYGLVWRGHRSNPDDHVWLNQELSFTPISAPSAGGAADEVIAVDRWGTGRAGFLVLNGFGRALKGPVQLIRVIRG